MYNVRVGVGQRGCYGDDVSCPPVTQHVQLLSYHWPVELTETDKCATAASVGGRHEQTPACRAAEAIFSTV